jgi:ribonuclease HII
MNFLAGVDEAGLGPILGPLVVAGVAMQGPEGTDPWRVLSRHVGKQKHQKGKVRVADSKKVNQGPHGLARLEATALVFWTALHGELPPTLGDWLQALGADLPQLRRCPWYEDLSLPLPRAADADWIRLHAELVARALRKAEVSVLEIAVRPVDVVEWNGLIADTDNKSRAHLQAYTEVIGRLLLRLPNRFEQGASGHLVADRAGGRMHYARDLQRLRPDARVEILREDPEVSSYRLHTAAGAVQVTFAEKGEDRAFPTALASCCAKYLRELMVEVLNGWFQARVPGLQATAGYYVDGHRFLDDLAPHLERLAVPTQRLVRVR